MNTFSEQQIRSYERTKISFEKVRYNILLAQMQSGKTDTYHLIACEMLRYGLIEQIIVFSGNRERELCEQLKTKNMKEFYEKYEIFLKERGIDKTEIFDKIKKSLQVIWGPQLKKMFPLLNHQNTLYIWEESHYAQTQKQHPAFVLQESGIPMDGDLTWFEKHNNYFLSVSATPFSEIVDNQEEQKKAIVHLSAGQNYKSVKWHLEKGNIHSYKNLEEGLELALETASTKRGYGLIRLTYRTQDAVMAILKKHNWLSILYDQKSPITNINKILETLPCQNTIILLKGKCRMGKQVSKQHVLFCFETSKYSKTDTLLQGLLGRCCGYHTKEDILIYLYKYHLESQELQRFMQMYDKKDTTPFRGANLKTPPGLKLNKYGKYCTIPEKITWTNKKLLISEIREMYRSGNIESFNSLEQQEEIKQQIMDETTIFKIHKLNPSFKQYEKIFPKIQTSLEKKYPMNHSMSEDEIHIWIHEEGYLYILTNTYSKPTNIIVPSFPLTTTREVFYK